jgi:diguanylate cyclase (GGDEF)-like protein
VSQMERWSMQAASLASRIKRHWVIRDWAWWRLPPLIRCYVAAVPLGAAATIGVAAAFMDWHLLDVTKFLLLMVCGVISVASTPRIAYAVPGVTRDFTTVWVLPTAILLPPVYAALMSIPLLATLQLFVHRGVVHRTVFTAGSISLSYATASMVFRLFPSSFAGETVGSGVHAFTWAVAVAICEIIGGRLQHLLVAGAVKLSNPQVHIWEMQWKPEALQGLFVAIDLGVMITVGVALSPALVLLALPTVLLVRRFVVHPLLVAQSRMDSKTGLLNVSTWEREAEIELSRAVRTRQSLALAILDIDHFKRVNDTHGHLVGDRVLRAVADMIKGQSRDYDKAGRFGGEEFVLLFAQADEDDACRIAERLRTHIGDLAVPIDDRPEAPVVQVTISIGVSAMERGTSRELTDLLTAADSALYRAKQAGRNRVCVSAPVQAGQLVAEIASQMGMVQEDPAGAALCPERSL